MSKPRTSIFIEPDAEARLYCAIFKDWLSKHYGKKHGAIRKFADECHLDVAKVYYQLNNPERLTEELREVIDKFMGGK